MTWHNLWNLPGTLHSDVYWPCCGLLYLEKDGRTCERSVGARRKSSEIEGLTQYGGAGAGRAVAERAEMVDQNLLKAHSSSNRITVFPGFTISILEFER